MALTMAIMGGTDAYAAEEPAGQTDTGEPQSLEEALMGGKVHLNIRVRAEIADMERSGASKQSNAYTERLRLGYGSRSYNGWAFYVEMEDIRSADDDGYNAAGLNANPTRTVVADPEDTELNQAFVTYDWKDASTKIKAGRQRIILDDARFVGNVGWRQNEQTFDAITVKSALSEDMTLLYGFLWDVNGILGPDAGADFDSESHLINLAYNGFDFGQVVLFGYHLDLDGQATAGASSSDTFGIRVTGKGEVNDDLAIKYALSYAHQVDAGDLGTVDYKADYYFAELSLVDEQMGHAGAGYEVLGSDGGKFGFQTPLATGHKFNGWADAFLTTPATGLQDFYVFAGTNLPWGVSGNVIYHWFWTEEGGGDLGEELDIILKKELSKNTTALAKFANFDGDGIGGPNRYKLWFQVEYKLN